MYDHAYRIKDSVSIVCMYKYFVVESRMKKKDQNSKCIRNCTLITRIKSCVLSVLDLFIPSELRWEPKWTLMTILTVRFLYLMRSAQFPHFRSIFLQVLRSFLFLRFIYLSTRASLSTINLRWIHSYATSKK